MPTMTTMIETKKILSGKSDGITRLLRQGCPYQPGQNLLLAYDEPVTHNQVPYAMVQIRSIRPGSVGERKHDDRLAKMEGFTNGSAWYNHFRKLYGDSDPSAQCHRIQFTVIKLYEEVVKNVG